MPSSRKPKQIFKSFSFLLTGDFNVAKNDTRFTHENLTRWIEYHGGTVQSEVNKNLTFLVASAEHFKKKVAAVQAAIKLKIPVVTYEFIEDSLIPRPAKLEKYTKHLHDASLKRIADAKKAAIRHRATYIKERKENADLVDMSECSSVDTASVASSSSLSPSTGSQASMSEDESTPAESLPSSPSSEFQASLSEDEPVSEKSLSPSPSSESQASMPEDEPTPTESLSPSPSSESQVSEPESESVSENSLSPSSIASDHPIPVSEREDEWKPLVMDHFPPNSADWEWECAKDKWRVYFDSTAFEFKITLTRLNMKDMTKTEQYVVFLFESIALPKYYTMAARYYRNNQGIASCKPADFSLVSDFPPMHRPFGGSSEGTCNFAEVFAKFKAFFFSKTGIPWDKRCDKLQPPSEDKFVYIPPKDGKPVGQLPLFWRSPEEKAREKQAQEERDEARMNRELAADPRDLEWVSSQEDKNEVRRLAEEKRKVDLWLNSYDA